MFWGMNDSVMWILALAVSSPSRRGRRKTTQPTLCCHVVKHAVENSGACGLNTLACRSWLCNTSGPGNSDEMMWSAGQEGTQFHPRFCHLDFSDFEPEIVISVRQAAGLTITITNHWFSRSYGIMWSFDGHVGCSYSITTPRVYRKKRKYSESSNCVPQYLTVGEAGAEMSRLCTHSQYWNWDNVCFSSSVYENILGPPCKKCGHFQNVWGL